MKKLEKLKKYIDRPGRRVLAFALVNYPIGAWASTKLTPVILGLPFSVFYFWTAYSLLVLAGVLLAWKVMRD